MRLRSIGKSYLGYILIHGGRISPPEFHSFRAPPTMLIEGGVAVPVSTEVTNPVSKRAEM